MVCQIQPKCVVEFSNQNEELRHIRHRCKGFSKQKEIHACEKAFIVVDLTYGQYCILPELYSEYGYVSLFFSTDNWLRGNKAIYTARSYQYWISLVKLKTLDQY